MASNSEFQIRTTSSWLGGFSNLLKKENQRWWGTRYWLVQLLVWLIIINGVIAAVYNLPLEDLTTQGSAENAETDEQMIQAMTQKPELVGLTIYVKLAGIVTAIGIIIIAQNAIISEKQSGTAAWVLSKPASRSAFVLSKVAGYGLGALGVMCLLVGAAVYVQIWLTTGVFVPILPFVGMLSLIFLNIFFYLTLSILLGTLFGSRGALLGIPLVVLFIYQIYPHIPAWLARLMPWNLVDSISHEALALTLVQGKALPTLTPIITTVIACLVFTWVASWRFNREEF